MLSFSFLFLAPIVLVPVVIRSSIPLVDCCCCYYRLINPSWHRRSPVVVAVFHGVVGTAPVERGSSLVWAASALTIIMFLSSSLLSGGCDLRLLLWRCVDAVSHSCDVFDDAVVVFV
jgi:hypothetical protein